MRSGTIVAGLLLASPSVQALADVGQNPLQRTVEAKLAEAGPGVRFGLMVTTTDGRELLAIAPDQRFIPASNTKIFTTAAAFNSLAELEAAGAAVGTRVRLVDAGRGRVDVVLEGRGDPGLSSAPDCRSNCLAELAGAVAARTRQVRNIVGDARFFPDERWSQGMSWNNIPTSSGTALAALTLDDNELPLRVSPTRDGQPAELVLPGYFDVENLVTTVAGEGSDLTVDRLPGSLRLRLRGTIGAAAAPRTLKLGVDDPAHFAAWRLKQLLEERQVKVSGTLAATYRAAAEPRAGEEGQALTSLQAEPLRDTLRTVNKVSQNLHAELLLRRLGSLEGNGSAEAGVAAVKAMLERAGVPAATTHLADGSGMSTYNRTTPRAMASLLRWIAGQSWGGAFRDTLPIGGIDGTLARRFPPGSALRGRIFAKTGSLNATNALAGYLLTAKGETLVFAFYANDVPEGVRTTAIMDEALGLIATAR